MKLFCFMSLLGVIVISTTLAHAQAPNVDCRVCPTFYT